ncbi:putative membrane protein YCR023C [Ceratocystis fimbriata CBS 114723]|uniref:Putative membrane protein YCR023C n=1 Tax=Ceratocystis fimbriata CBS 114723 TaxID=1035309 RepID=A0A2C5X3G3_9PEZI|nr:putative membrane protein YCR023C [Ceratocystis fimbriata CBS 114723]
MSKSQKSPSATKAQSSRSHAPVTSDTKPPFPSRQMFVLAMCRICEPIAFMSIFPYIYYMVEDFHITDDPSQISVYAGMVTSAFTLAEFSTGVFWGKLSDRVGRKPILLCGLAGTGLSALVFGFAPSLLVALIARSLGGLLNGNIGVLQTTVAEMITVKEYQPRAYTIMPLVWCLGSIVGPMIGGALARPCISYPTIFPRGTIFDKYPYLLPNLFSAIAVFCGLIIGVLFLKETHPIKKHRRDVGLETGDRILAWFDNKSRHLRGKEAKIAPTMSYDDYEEDLPGYRTSDNSPSLSSVHAPDPQEPLDLNEPREDQPLLQNSRARPPMIRETQPPAKTFTRPVILNIISYGILAFHTMTFDQLFPVFLSTNPPENPDIHLPFKFVSGFGFETKTIGFILAIQGGYSMISTVFLFPLVARFVGPRRLFKIIAMSYFILYLVTPYVVLLPESIRMYGVYLLVIWKCIFSTMAYPSNAILLTNSAPSDLSLGTINGIAASTASLCRAFGPTISGLLYAAGLRTGYSGMAWWCSGLVSIVGAIISLQIPEPKGRLDVPREDEEAYGDDSSSE